MNILKIAVGMNFLAAVLFLINAGLSVYRDRDDYWKYIGLALLFAFLGLMYRRRYKKKMQEEQD